MLFVDQIIMIVFKCAWIVALISPVLSSCPCEDVRHCEHFGDNHNEYEVSQIQNQYLFC